MGEIFKGWWRRKTGVVTLVMACVFTAGCARSLVVQTGIVVSMSEPDDTIPLENSPKNC